MSHRKSSHPFGKTRNRKLSAVEARAEAQRLAFSPFMFQAVRVMVTSGLLTRILEKGGMTPEAIHEAQPELSMYAITVLLEAGLACGVLEVSDGRFSCTKIGWFLARDTLTRTNLNFAHSVCYQGLYHLEEALRDGTPSGLATLGDWPTVYEGLSELPEPARTDWFAFDHYYSDQAFAWALPLVFETPPSRLLDIGGNTGKFAVSAAALNPEVRLTICDLPGQLRVAKTHIEKAGLSQRIAGCEINLLDEKAALPPGHDAAWMSQFLCCFSEPEIVGILGRVRDAVGPNGRVFIMDTFWDRQEHEAAAYSLIATSLYFTAMANGNSRMYKYDAMADCIQSAGLVVEQLHDNPKTGHTLLVCRPEGQR